MFCKRCGDIVNDQSAKCRKCGGLAVEPIAGSSAASAGERKDPWSSTYLQKRLKPTNTTARPNSSYMASSSATGQNEYSFQRPIDRAPTGSPKYRLDNSPRYHEQQPQLGLPRQVRDATAGTRPVSMYAGAAVLDSQVQSAIQRTVAPQNQQMQPERQLKSKWSQYFTSTAGNGASGGVSPQVSLAANANIRARSESLSSGGARENNNNNSSGIGASNSALYGTRILSKQEDPISSTSSQPRPFAAVQRPLTSDGQTRGYNLQSTELPPVRRLGVGAQNG
ncbi:hypothetical protein IW150_007265, partial [Coemansia sp. RSA 2607]